jgi:glycerol-3-phosphate dehydrogenase
VGDTVTGEHASGAGRRYDIIIVGAGVVGCAIARQLAAYDLSIAVLEKCSYVVSGQSKGNGAVIHGGHDPHPGTVKAPLNIRGNAMMRDLCASLGVTWWGCGVYVVAYDEREQGILRQLLDQASVNGVKGARIIDRDEVRRTEPNLGPAVHSALSVPSASMVDGMRLVIALAEQAAVNGVEFHFAREVTAVHVEHGAVTGVTAGGERFNAPVVINCAGVNTDLVMRMAGLEPLRIIPRIGQYWVFDRDYGMIVSRPCFQVPIPGGKGIVLHPTVHGNTVVGGDSVPVDDRTDTGTTAEGLEVVRRSISRLAPNLDYGRLIAAYCGIRSATPDGDFLIEASAEVRGLVNVAGIASPGLTAAPAIAEDVRDMVDRLLPLKERAGGLRPHRIQPVFRDMSGAEKEEALRLDPTHGTVVCRCEYVTEGDVRAALLAPLPARTLDAVKVRTRAGMGRCSGAFDLSRLLSIMSRELGVPPWTILKNDPPSSVVIGDTRPGAVDA